MRQDSCLSVPSEMDDNTAIENANRIAVPNNRGLLMDRLSSSKQPYFCRTFGDFSGEINESDTRFEEVIDI